MSKKVAQPQNGCSILLSALAVLTALPYAIFGGLLVL